MGLQHLERLTRLREVYLEGTLISDVGLIHLAGLTQFQALGLGSTRITDSGLQHSKD